MNGPGARTATSRRPLSPAQAAAGATPRVGQPSPLILFGAFDRHNLGDLLLGRIAAELAARLLPGRELRFAGLAVRDLRADGGARVEALAELVAEWKPPRRDTPPPGLLQVGGEILDCSAWEAAVMLLDTAGAARAIALYDHDPAARAAWARHTLGVPRGLPYLAAHAALPPGTRSVHTGIGGVGFAALPAALRAEALAELRAAAGVQVRDRCTRDALAAAGLDAALVPDPAVLVERLLGAEVAHHAATGEVAALRARFARGYVAVQLAAEFGDDATLATLAGELAAIQRERDLGIVLFCAGRAPWHDDPDVLQRLRRRLPDPEAAVIAASPHVMDLCALIANAALCCASSLHARIVADAFARPAIGLLPGGAPQAAKLRAWLDTWHPPRRHHLAASGNLRALARSVLDEAPAERKAQAVRLADLAETAARAAFARLFDPIDPEDKTP
ncbi:polysaccharide pyruvyl transferase family protein [Thauera sp.]|uniref:polysaccharide pyruvyl transferase family protein n=1 Tax=Thauera sp. TaxID=1905334 RepID=UPI001B52C056|nr:polysaccharide pyruvyl transferase family protein [Thauera sp.]MBP6132101.1 polysaccharide pyruvyl transferase family protein [Thauera sp.]MBP7046389.1 polysaccharide pyruvyl transferase family protein [Thauera sp.]